MHALSIKTKLYVPFLALIAILSSCEPQEESIAPNVLFITIDDLNDWVGPLGGHPQVQTPHIDRLAAMGTTFTNAHCQAPLCNPSRTSILTGLRPSSTGIYGLAPWFRNLDSLKALTSLPQHFSNHGYRTYSTGKIFHGGYGRQKGDMEFDTLGPGASVGPTPEQKIIGVTPGGNNPLMDWGTFPHRDEDKGDYIVADWAVQVLESQPEEPFFLSAGFFLPHVPCFATQKWFDLYPIDSLVMPPIRINDREDTPDFSWYLHWYLPEPRLKWLEENQEWRHLVQSYLASISFVDAQVGRLLDALEASGKSENTIIVLWSDHGYHLGEKAISGKNTLWERSTRVPLIFAGKDIPQATKANAPVELLDIYPTLIDLCKLNPIEYLEGESLINFFTDPNMDWEKPAITTHNQGNHSVRTKDWRYIHYADGSEELYNLKGDPHEWYNLADDPEHQSILGQHRLWLPGKDLPPAPGSKHRILEYQNGIPVWQGDTIKPGMLSPLDR
ncbi:MAG: sulfatase [Bacteroidota bacterium]